VLSLLLLWDVSSSQKPLQVLVFTEVFTHAFCWVSYIETQQKERPLKAPKTHKILNLQMFSTNSLCKMIIFWTIPNFKHKKSSPAEAAYRKKSFKYLFLRGKIDDLGFLL
jgi:hypothetical protein